MFYPKISRLRTTAVALIVLQCLAWSEDRKKEEANQLLLRSAEVSVTPAAKRSPFHEDATIAFYQLEHGSTTGALRLDWANPDNFIEEITQDKYQLMVVKKDAKLYRHENMTFTPVRIQQFRSLLPPWRILLGQTDIVRGIRDRRVGDVSGRCIEFNTVRGTEEHPSEVCVAKDDARLLSRTYDRFRFTWTNYESFAGKLLPRHAELTEDGEKIVVADFTWSEAPQLTAEAIRIPAGLKPEPTCRSLTPPVLKAAPDPSYPLGPRGIAHVILSVLVGIDGKVHDLQLIQSTSSRFDESAQEAVKRWSFTPANCDGVPVERKAQVEVDFRPRP